MQFQKKNPYPPHGMSLKIPRGRGVLKVKNFRSEVLMKLNWNFLGGGYNVSAKQKTFRGESIDILWNCSHYEKHGCQKIVVTMEIPCTISTLCSPRPQTRVVFFFYYKRLRFTKDDKH